MPVHVTEAWVLLDTFTVMSEGHIGPVGASSMGKCALQRQCRVHHSTTISDLCLLLQPILVPPSAPAVQFEATQLVSSVLTTCCSAPMSISSVVPETPSAPLQHSAEALLRLAQLYNSQQVPLEPIQHPTFMKLLLTGSLLVPWRMCTICPPN